MEEIKYKVIAMRNQRPKENTEAVLKLFDDHLEWTADFEAEEPKSDEYNDHSQGWEDIRSYYCIVTKKEHIFSVELEFQQTPERLANVDKDKWVVRIIQRGTDISMYFRTKKKADEVFETVKKWLINV